MDQQAMSRSAPTGQKEISRHQWKAIVAVTGGTAMEAYEVTIYGFMAVVISRLFFPAVDESLSLLLALGTYGVTFIMRPLGAAILGAYGDRRGRKEAVSLAMMLMAIGSLMIALMPTYQMIGIFAPLGMLLARFLQGFSVGGQQGNAATYLAEQHPARRGEFSSWLFVAEGFMTLLAAGTGALLAWSLTQAQLESWGWRLPFLMGAILYPISIFIRKRASETMEFQAAGTTSNPIKDSLRLEKKNIILAAVIFGTSTITAYLMIFMPSYAETVLQLSAGDAFLAGIVAGLTTMLLAPLFGALSDRIGRFKLMFPAAALLAALSWPAFTYLVHNPSWLSLLIIQTMFAAVAAAYKGASVALITELFPTQTRSTNVSLSAALSVTVFGGFAPFILASLVTLTNDKSAPSFYIMATALVSGSILLHLRATKRIS